MAPGIQFEDGGSRQFENESSFLAYLGEKVIPHTNDELNYSVDQIWLIVCAGLVFFMQTGFALVEVGNVRMKNTKNILMKNMLDACVGAISFWLIGYAFAFGKDNAFIGVSGLALKSLETTNVHMPSKLYDGHGYAFFLFQFAFAATAATIVSGAVAERCKIEAYFVYSFFLTVFIYPVVVHWGWSETGWASAFAPEKDLLFGVGVIDFAGSTIVHTVGGATALVGAFFLGPRTGRFAEGKPQNIAFQSSTFQTAGTLILWFGWYGFNCGSTLTVTGVAGDVAGKVAVTTTISAAASGIVATIFCRIFDGTLEIGRTNNGILGGLVSITAGCAVVDVEVAFIIGLIGGAIYFGASKLLEKLEIDDVVDASPVHFFCGIWGTLAAGLFAKPENVEMAYTTGSCGLFYECDGKGPKQFAANLVFILVVTAWTMMFATLIFGLLKVFKILRVNSETERIGLDVKEHGGKAYEEQTRQKTRRESFFKQFIRKDDSMVLDNSNNNSQLSHLPEPLPESLPIVEEV